MADPLHWLYEHIEAQDNPTTLGRLRAVADEIERLRAEIARRDAVSAQSSKPSTTSTNPPC